MDQMENTSKCSSNEIPSIPEYLSATNVYGITLVSMGTVAVLVVVAMFLDTFLYVMKNASSKVKAHTAFVIGVYPVISLVTYFAILVPRSHLIAEAITQGMFMAGMYQLFCLFVAYCDGEAEVVRRVKPAKLSLQVNPLCCFPCCKLLPTFHVTKKSVRTLRFMVLQLPIFQSLVYLTLIVMWAERESLYRINYLYIQPLIGISILIGIWGISMMINILKSILVDEFIIGKFIVLQMVLLLAKMQGFFTRALVWMDLLPCKPPITPAVYGNLLHNTLMLGEMVLLGAVARFLYKRRLPETVDVPTKITTIGSIMSDDFANNNNNNNQIVIKSEKELIGYENHACDIKL
ncbi:organic solute transporter subunit alpha [Aethina tumida]|uniref:organic solute transporter subunit alpha n=1 Tax=Aethina tumida TaxID=116153 RepID=UPI00096AE018|nr:organic solute transporter subunit alpha [Aethina tumida]